MHAITCAATAMVALVLASSSSATAADKVYKIYLSNNFVGNDWRQQMLRSAQVAASKPPLAGRVQLTIDNAESKVEAQINALNNIIREKPDAIIIDAGSGDALNPTIEKACSAGIVVVSFDQVVTAPCAYKLQSNFDTMGANQAAWMVATLGGKGNVIIDRGLAGAPVAERFVKMFEDGMKAGPGIKIVGYYTGEYSLGPEQAGVSSLLAANPEIDGILTLSLRHRRHESVGERQPQHGADCRRRFQRHRGRVSANSGREMRARREPALSFGGSAAHGGRCARRQGARVQRRSSRQPVADQCAGRREIPAGNHVPEA